MEPQSDHPPIVVIVGPTASGKSALALDLAERYNGEIVAADSRTVYRGMNIGTAKPTAAEQARVPYWLLDVAAPDERFTASDFQQLAQKAIANIVGRQKVAFIVGGTGLYIDSLLFDFSFQGPADPARREQLQTLSVPELQGLLQAEGIALPANSQNPRHLVRRLETAGTPDRQRTIRPRTLIIGIDIAKADLAERVARRTDAMLAAGLEKEVRQLAQRYGWELPSLMAIGYQEFRPYLAGQILIEDVRSSIVTHTLQYAKRQKTWFKRNNTIHWISNAEEAVDLVTTFLNK